MNIAKEIDKYLFWSLNQTRILFDKGFLVKKNNNSISALDLPIFKTEKEYNNLIKIAARSGYHNFNIGLTPIWLKKSPLTVKTIKKMSIISAHGTSLKKEIATNKPYREFLLKDLKTLKQIDPNKKWLVNYDLFAGHLPELNFYNDFKKTRTESAKLLIKKLKLSANQPAPELLVIGKIIQDVAAVYKKSQRKICFELPGTKGWSLFPEPSNYYLDFIIKQIKKYIPTATICIDLGHVVTWQLNNNDIKKIGETFVKYKESISMLHISSAGSSHPAFINAYQLWHGKNYPDWHIKSLDLALPIFELPILNLLNLLRREIKGKLVEVSENRLPSAAINDYFPGFNKIKFDKKKYYQGLLEQGKILGYLN